MGIWWGDRGSSLGAAYIDPQSGCLLWGAVGGWGMGVRGSTGAVRVRSLIEGGAAARDGRVRAGDRILAVDRRETAALSKSDVIQLIAGPVGTPVELLLSRGAGGSFSVTLIRTAAGGGSGAAGGGPGRAAGPPSEAGDREPSLAFLLGVR